MYLIGICSTLKRKKYHYGYLKANWDSQYETFGSLCHSKAESLRFTKCLEHGRICSLNHGKSDYCCFFFQSQLMNTCSSYFCQAMMPLRGSKMNLTPSRLSHKETCCSSAGLTSGIQASQASCPAPHLLPAENKQGPYVITEKTTRTSPKPLPFLVRKRVKHTHTHTYTFHSFNPLLWWNQHLKEEFLCKHGSLIWIPFALRPLLLHYWSRICSSQCQCSTTVYFYNFSDFVTYISVVLAALDSTGISDAICACIVYSAKNSPDFDPCKV